MENFNRVVLNIKTQNGLKKFDMDQVKSLFEKLAWN